MRLTFTALFFLGMLHFAAGQTEQVFEKTITINGQFSYFAIDDLLNIYTVIGNNEIVKYNIEGREQFRYSNNIMGNLATLDVSNPLNIILFYPDYQVAITLDRTLSQTGEFDLFGPETLEVTAVCLSIENKLWVFDASDYRLKLIDEGGTVIEESDDLSLYFNTPPVITQMEAHNNYIYTNVPESGIIIFDDFAQFDKELPFPNLIYFQFFNHNLIFQRENNLYELDLETLHENILSLPEKIKPGTIVKVKNNYVFYMEKGKEIEVWKIMVGKQ